MYGISPQWRTPDVYKWYSTNDAGNSSALTETNAAYTVTEDVQTVLDNLWQSSNTVATLPIASTADFKSGHKYLIHNVSSSRNGYLKVDPEHNITWATLPSTTRGDYSQFIFTVEENSGNLVLKANDGRYFPSPTSDQQAQTQTVDGVSNAGPVVLAVKSGYPASTFNVKVNSHYLNVNEGGGVTTWDQEGDVNGVWELTPVNEDNWVTSTVTSTIALADGTTKTIDKVTDGKFMSGQTIVVAWNSLIPTVTTTVSAMTTTVSQTETLPFKPSTTIDDNATWYYLNLRDNNTSSNNSKKWIKYDSSNSNNVSESTTFDENSKDNFTWAFKGNSIDGIQLYNKAAGYTNSLQMTDSKATIASGSNDKWVIGLNGDGFTLRTSASGTKYLHDINQAWGYWDNSSAATDEGSTFRAYSVELDEAYPTGVYAFKNSAGTGYGYMGIAETTSGGTSYNLVGNNQNLDLNSIVQLTRTEPLHYNISVEGQKLGTVSQSATVSINTTNNAVYRLVQLANGNLAFTSIPSGTYTYLHSASNSTDNYRLVGWTTVGAATQWADAKILKINYSTNDVATFYAPFDVYLFNAKAYTVSLSSDESTANLTVVPETEEYGNPVTRIPANTGVILYKNSGATNIQVMPVASLGTTSELTSALTGCYINTTWSATSDGKTNLVLGRQTDGTLGFYPHSETVLPAHHCYLSVTTAAAAKGIKVNFDQTTGINGVKTEGNLNGKIYNLQGQAVGANYKGMVIKNGKKYVQK